MSLKSLPIPPIPEEVVRVAHALFPRGNVFMQVRDTLGTIYTDEAFADLFPTHGQTACAPWRLALVTIFQFMEGLTDRQAADAVRDRLTWKYALSLELTDAGFDHTVLSEFRSRLVEGHAEQRLLDLLLLRCREGEWLKAHRRQRTDSTHILARIRSLSRTLTHMSRLIARTLASTWVESVRCCWRSLSQPCSLKVVSMTSNRRFSAPPSMSCKLKGERERSQLASRQ